jgi:hypothetical protein
MSFLLPKMSILCPLCYPKNFLVKFWLICQFAQDTFLTDFVWWNERKQNKTIYTIQNMKILTLPFLDIILNESSKTMHQVLAIGFMEENTWSCWHWPRVYSPSTIVRLLLDWHDAKAPIQSPITQDQDLFHCHLMQIFMRHIQSLKHSTLPNERWSNAKRTVK